MYRQDQEKMDSRIPSPMESEIEKLKKTCAKLHKGELVWIVDDSVKRFENKL